MVDSVKKTSKIPWTYRVRGVPLKWTESDLSTFLIRDTNCNLKGGGFEIKSLALNTCKSYQIATVESLDGTPLPESIKATAKSITASKDDVVRLQCDDKFDGLTTLYSPAEQKHHVDVVVVCGLNGHPIGSFRPKKSGDDYLWLRDALPQHLTAEGSNEPFARIMTYGYESPVADSEHYEHIGGLAVRLRESLCTLEAQRPLVFIAHSLGGIILKQAMISASRSEQQDHVRLLARIYGIAFFGVPHAGMNVERLAAMAGKGPALGIVVNLSEKISQVLDEQRQEFSRTLAKCGRKELFCFHETLLSPTPKKVDGEWKMLGPKTLLVNKTSATHCTSPGEEGSESFCAIPANHSDIIKFELFDNSYDELVKGRMRGLCRRALEAGKQREDPWRRAIIPYTKNDSFIGRRGILDEIQKRFELEKPAEERRCRRLSLYGLGGIGKTQIAIHFAYWVKEQYKHISVFWVHASNEQRFRQGYNEIATVCYVPGRDDPESDICQLVHNYLSNSTKRPWLLIIDNADDKELFHSSNADELGFVTAQGLARYLPECDHGSILMTTRDKNVGSSFTYAQAAQIVVDKLSREEAVQLVRKAPGCEETTQSRALELSDRMERLPLALSQALAYIDKNSITIERYIREIDQGNDSLVKKLSQPFAAAGRDTETPNAVTAAWVISFRQIQKNDQLACELLSLISMFDRQTIQEKFVDIYLEHVRRVSADGVRKESKTESLGTLKGYSFIASTADDTYDMHRLVHLVTRKWLLVEGQMHDFAARALVVVKGMWPVVDWDTMDKMTRLMPHAMAVLGNLSSEEESHDTKRRRGHLLLAMTEYCVRSSQIGNSEMHAEAAYRLLKESVGSEDEDTLEAAKARLEVYDRRRSWAEGIKFGEVERRRAERVLGKEHLVTLRITGTLGRLYQGQGNLEQAEELMCFVLATFEKHCGFNHHSTLTSLSELGLVYHHTGRSDTALKLQQKLAETRTRLEGKEHPDTLTSQHNVAWLLQNQGKFEEAGRIFAHVAEVAKRVFGPDHHCTLSSVHCLALNHYHQGHFEQAVDLVRYVWELEEKSLGRNHPATLTTMNNYAILTHATGQTSRAIDLMRDWCIRSEETWGSTHEVVIHSRQWLREREQEEAEIKDQDNISDPTPHQLWARGLVVASVAGL